MMTVDQQLSIGPSGTQGTPSGLSPVPPSSQTGVIVDVHTHLWESLEQLGEQSARQIRRGSSEEPWERPDTTQQAYDQAMEPVGYAFILGIECRAIGASIPAEQVAGYVARHPDKYIGFAGVDPIAPGSTGAVDQAVELGLAGVSINPSACGYHPSDTRAMLLYEQCEHLGLPIIVHPGTHLAGSSKLEYSQPYLYDEVARTFPQLKLVIAGAGLPWAEQVLVLIAKHEHCYADLSDLSRRPWQLYNVLLLAYQQEVTSRLLFGSDFPFTTPEQAIHNIYSVNTVTHGTHLPVVPREQLRSIVERDALACLGLEAPKSVVGETE